VGHLCRIWPHGRQRAQFMHRRTVVSWIRGLLGPTSTDVLHQVPEVLLASFRLHPLRSRDRSHSHRFQCGGLSLHRVLTRPWVIANIARHCSASGHRILVVAPYPHAATSCPFPHPPSASLPGALVHGAASDRCNASALVGDLALA